MEFFESALRQHDKVGRGQCYAIAICTEMTDEMTNELTNQNQSISQRPLLLSVASRHNQKINNGYAMHENEF